MSFLTQGLHHVTAVATRPQGNVDFYVRVLGLRLVKRTVNFEDPRTYHLYYGDASGKPGTLLSFYAWPGVGPGHPGTGEGSAVALAVPTGALPYWQARLEHHFSSVRREHRFGADVLCFHDPDGLALELVERDGVLAEPWTGGDVEAAHAIFALDGVTLRVSHAEPTATFLQQALGLELTGEEEEAGQRRVRLAAAGEGLGRFVDLVETGQVLDGRTGAGSVHHVGFRAADGSAQAQAQASVLAAGGPSSKSQDRFYFTTTYFHEPAGTLLEVATDGPGFTIDEPLDELGLSLRLPTWLEEDRSFLRGRLPVIASPEYADRWGTS